MVENTKYEYCPHSGGGALNFGVPVAGTTAADQQNASQVVEPCYVALYLESGVVERPVRQRHEELRAAPPGEQLERQVVEL